MECIPGGVVGVRQWPSRYTTHTGQYLPGKECCYLRTLVLVYTYGHPSLYPYSPWYSLGSWVFSSRYLVVLTQVLECYGD